MAKATKFSPTGIKIDLMDQAILRGKYIRYHEANGLLFLVQDDISKKILGEYSNKNFYDMCRGVGRKPIYISEMSTHSNVAASTLVDIIEALEFYGGDNATQAAKELRSWHYKIPSVATKLPAPVASEASSGLSITNTTIRQDQEGRFCLNDLHKAAGGAERDKPANWLRIEQTAKFIEAISNCSEVSNKPVESTSGRYGGTYVCKELVYHYAMWISPEFSLKVIRAYDGLVSRPAPEVPVQIAQSQKLLELSKEIQAAMSAQIEQMIPKVEVYDEFLSSDEGVLLTELAKSFDMSGVKLGAYLRGKKVLWATAVRPIQHYTDLGWFTSTRRRQEDSEGAVSYRYDPLITPAGQLGIRQMLMEDGLL